MIADELGVHKVVVALPAEDGQQEQETEALMFISNGVTDHYVTVTPDGFTPRQVRAALGDRVWFAWDSHTLAAAAVSSAMLDDDESSERRSRGHVGQRNIKLSVQQVDVPDAEVPGGVTSICDTAGAVVVQTDAAGVFFYTCPTHSEPRAPFVLSVIYKPDLR